MSPSPESSPRPLAERLVSPGRRRCLQAASLAPLLATIGACGGGGDASVETSALETAAGLGATARRATVATRSWRMGFGGLPPRLTVASVVQNIDNWSQRADLAAIHDEVPWAELLAGADAAELIQRDKLGLANYYRFKGLKLLFVAELNDGMAREAEAPALRALGRSLTEPTVQRVWRNYVMAAARLLQPEWICLAAETNLVRLAAPAALYNAVRGCANAAAADIRAAALSKAPILMSSVQVETAWGALPGQNGQFLGIAADRTDFAFTECLGLSSYAYLAHAVPESIPDNWYQRVLAGSRVPTMVVEGGWTSVSVGTRSSSPDVQRRYIERHAQLLDGISARGWIQLYYADLDLPALDMSVTQALQLFAHLGLTDSDFKPKPALAVWDTLHTRKLI
jgi:hypothetical protein